MTAEEVGLEVVEFELIDLVRSRVSEPAPVCILMLASTSEEDGAVLLKAHTMLCLVSEFA